MHVLQLLGPSVCKLLLERLCRSKMAGRARNQPTVAFAPPPGQWFVYSRKEYTFYMEQNDETEALRASKWNSGTGTWEEFEVDWQRLGNVEDQFDNLNWDFVAMLVMSGFLFQFMRDLRLARFVRKAQLLIEQAKGRQFTSKHFSQVQA